MAVGLSDKPNTVITTGDDTAIVVSGAGIQGGQGETGATGAQGPAGSAASIAVGSTTTLAAGAAATVANSGSSSAAVFDFGIPQGATGAQGPAGTAATITVGTVTSGTAPAVTNSGTSSAAVLNFTLQKGDKGDTGATGATGATGPEGGTSTLTTKGDLLGRSSSAVARVAVGTDGYVLTADSTQTTGVKWAAATGGISPTIVDAKGDLIVATANDTVTRLGVGATNGFGLVVDSTTATGVAWSNISALMMRRVSGYYYNGTVFDSVAASTSTFANRMTFFPFYNPYTYTYSAAAIQVINNVASSNCRFGIYNDNEGQPGSLVIDYGGVSTATSGAKEVTSSVTLNRGFYWAALLLDTAAVTFRTMAPANNFTLGRGSNSAVSATYGGLAVVTYGALPDPAPSAVLGQTFTAGCIYLKA